MLWYSRMPTKTELRRLPRQSRGKQRVEELLDAAAAEISSAGYDAATMSSIAARAGASIGSLYQFFPNKGAIVRALRERYCDEFAAFWGALTSEAKHLSWKQLAVRLVDSTVAFAERHPAFLALLDAPASTCSSAQVRQRFQKLVATFLVARKPRLAPEKALRLATMTLHMIKAMNFLYRDVSEKERRVYAEEFKILLSCYLERRMNSE
jgi:AcrR family transcriptional regulator